MSKRSQDIPSCLKKKALLENAQLTQVASRDLGRKFLAQERWDDALEFFLQAGDTDSLNEMVDMAVERGDAYQLERLLKEIPRESPEELWQTLGAQAREQGKLLFAHRAFVKAGNEVMAARMQQLLNPAPTLAAPLSHEQE